MKHTRQLFCILTLLVFVQQQAFAQRGDLNLSFKGGMEMDQGRIVTLLLSSFIIGNIVAWSMGAYPRDFPAKPYSDLDRRTIQDLHLEIEQNPDEADIRTELGVIYFSHNDLDKAETVLSSAVDRNPENAEALAVYSANEAKQSGAMWDFTWGISKLHRLGKAVDGLNRSVELDPENFTVRLYRVNTLLGLDNRKESFARIFDDELWFLKHIESDPDYFPWEVKLEFYKALSAAYRAWEASASEAHEKKRIGHKAHIYQQKLITLGNKP